MRNRIIRLTTLARRKAPLATPEMSHKKRKNWFIRAIDSTAIPFFAMQLRRLLWMRARGFIALVMLIVPRSVYRMEVRGIENYNYQPSTLLVCGHKRDLDVPMAVGIFHSFPRTFKQRRALQHLFVPTRDDIFEVGHLLLYFPVLEFFRPLISRIRMDWYFGGVLQGCPVKLPDEQTVNQLLQETLRVEGNFPAAEAFEEEVELKLLGDKAGDPQMTIADAILHAPFSVLAQYATPRIFAEPLASRIRQRQVATMSQQLDYLVKQLDRGMTLLLMPEGQVTPDGKFSKPRAAAIRLVQQTRTEVRLLPINITYDFMDTLRASTTYNIGTELCNVKQLSKQQLTDLIRQEIGQLACVTLSGLASRWLIEAVNNDKTELHPEEFKVDLWNELQRLRQLGLHLDTQLATRQEFEQRLSRFLDYGRTRDDIFSGWGKRKDDQGELEVMYLNLPALRRTACAKHSDNPVRYCYNELTELLANYDALPDTDLIAPPNVVPLKKSSRRMTAG